MRNLTSILLACTLTGILSGCNPLPDTSAHPSTQLAYIDEFRSVPQTRISVNNQGGQVDLTPRLSGITDRPVTLEFSVDKELLEAYNKENNTKFELLPEEAFTLEVLGKSGEVIDSGKTLRLEFSPQEFQKRVVMKVLKMTHTVTNEEGEEIEENFPIYKNFAIPVKIHNVEGSNAALQSTGTSGIVFLNRKFEAKALHLKNSALKFAYKTADATFDGDIEYKNWTYQFFLRIDNIRENFGFMYPNLRGGKQEEWGYNCLYGGALTYFLKEGKYNFNQPSFENYHFKPNVWYHIAATFETAEDGINTIKMYLNGELAFQSATSGKSQGWSNPCIGNGSFNGYLRDLRIWDKALTAGEINETMWAVNPEAEGLTLYMPFDGNVKSIIPGKENDWILLTSSDSFDFETSFTLPE